MLSKDSFSDVQPQQKVTVQIIPTSDLKNGIFSIQIFSPL